MARTDVEAGTRLSEVQDFIARYMTGDPSRNFSGEEALRHYDTIVPHLSPREFEEAAEAAFLRMTPLQREQLGNFLHSRAHQQSYNFPELGGANVDQFRDARQLARIVTSLERKQERSFRMLMVDGGQAGLGRFTASGTEQSDAFRHPLFKAVIGGIAAMALDSMIRNRGTAAGRPSELT